MRVTGSGNAHKLTVTPTLMQARRSAYAVYTKCMEEGKYEKRRLRQQPMRMKIHRTY